MKLKTKNESVNHVLDNIDTFEIIDKKTGYSIKLITTLFKRDIKTGQISSVDFDVIICDENGRPVKKHVKKEITRLYEYICSTLHKRKKSARMRYYVIKTMLAITLSLKKQKAKIKTIDSDMSEMAESVIDSIKSEIISEG